MVDSVAKFLNLPMQTGPGIDVPANPIHEHPHPTADDADAEETAPDAATSAPAARPAGAKAGAGTAPGAKASAGAEVEITNEADKARAQRLGFRRWRG
jgi:hypothetical protein